jgi:glycosyltransferase involved in cell wall biosynthesis
MNILIVIPSLEIGGAQANVLRLASELHRTHHRVFILDLKPERRDVSFVEGLLLGSIPIFSPPFFDSNNRRTSSYGNSINLISRIRLKIKSQPARFQEFIAENNIHILNSHMYLADLFLSQFLSKSRPPVVSKQCGCYNLISLEKQSQGKIEEWKSHVTEIFSKIDGVITLAQHHEEFLQKYAISKPHRKIYNGITKQSANHTKNKSTGLPLKVVMCARDEASKGWIIALEAIHFLLVSGKSIEFDLIGDGPYLQSIKHSYHHPGITFLGQDPSPLSKLPRYDVGLLPTYFSAESLPNAIIEYQASGLATIATDIGEIPSLIKDEGLISGKIIPLDDKYKMTQALASALTEYLENRELLKVHQQNAKLLSERFNVEKTAQAYVDFFSIVSN